MGIGPISCKCMSPVKNSDVKFTLILMITFEYPSSIDIVCAILHQIQIGSSTIPNILNIDQYFTLTSSCAIGGKRFVRFVPVGTPVPQMYPNNTTILHVISH